jgi:hypothetical protein
VPDRLWQSTCMREPRWNRAAYTQSPTVRAATGSAVAATAAVECWRGTVDELFSPVTELLQAAGSSPTQHAFITLSNGVQIRRRSAAALAAALRKASPEDLLSIRFEVSNEENFPACL